MRKDEDYMNTVHMHLKCIERDVSGILLSYGTLLQAVQAGSSYRWKLSVGLMERGRSGGSGDGSLQSHATSPPQSLLGPAPSSIPPHICVGPGSGLPLRRRLRARLWLRLLPLRTADLGVRLLGSLGNGVLLLLLVLLLHLYVGDTISISAFKGVGGSSIVPTMASSQRRPQSIAGTSLVSAAMWALPLRGVAGGDVFCVNAN